IKPILTTDCPSSDHAVAWISPYPKSRVVYIQLGHGHTLFYHPSYRALVHNAILWAAAERRRSLLETQPHEIAPIESLPGSLGAAEYDQPDFRRRRAEQWTNKTTMR